MIAGDQNFVSNLEPVKKKKSLKTFRKMAVIFLPGGKREGARCRDDAVSLWCPRPPKIWFSLAKSCSEGRRWVSKPDLQSSVLTGPLVPPRGRQDVSRQKQTSPGACLDGSHQTHRLSPACPRHHVCRTTGATKANPSAALLLAWVTPFQSLARPHKG